MLLLQIVSWVPAGILLVLFIPKLLSRGWFGGWLKGNFVLVLLAVGFAFASLAIDLRAYNDWQQEKKIAQITLTEFEPGAFIAELEQTGGQANAYELRGDEWQLDARIIKWRGAAVSMGLRPVYRLNRLSGRYLALSKERDLPRYVHEMGSTPYTIDTWRILHSSHQYIPWLMPQYGSATYMPMVDGARYDIFLSGTGLTASPVNNAAKTAVSQWQ